jgi:hypothetical protein
MGKIDDLVNMIKERRFGFQMDEVMSGEHEFEPGFGPKGKLPIEFRVTWGPKHITKWANPFGGEFMTQGMAGSVSVEGLCKNAACSGTLELKYFSEAKIRYTFEFGVNGKEYKFVGEKVNIKPWNLPVSHTTCFGVLTEKTTGKLVSRSVLHFRMKTAPAFILSMRLA